MRAQVIFTATSGNPQDNVTNTWYFDGDDPNDPPGPSDGDYHDGVVSLLNGLYGAVKGYYSDLVQDNPQVKIYDMRDPEPRVPEFVGNLTMDIPVIGANFRLPQETCIALSFKADPVSGGIPARRRGRVFLGPLNSSAMGVSGGKTIVADACRAAIAAAAGTMKAGYGLPLDQGDVQWAIYSRRTDELGANVDDSFHDVTAGWVDDALDTQRRRGAKPTVRSVF
jgi:hypothetical protein